MKVGDKVKKGQVITIFGCTGCSSNPHLHFMLADENGNSKEVDFGIEINREKQNLPDELKKGLKRI